MVDETDREYSNPKEDPSYPEYEYEQGDQYQDDLQMLDGMIRDRIEEVDVVASEEKLKKIEEISKEIHESCIQFPEEFIEDQMKILLGEDIND